MATIDKIKFDGLQKEWLVYRYPGDSFVSGTQLIVSEGQVAVFVKSGQALDYFTAGTYTLSSANIPLLQNAVNAPFGGKTPYAADIYFINKTSKLDMNWGTTTPIQLIDPKYNIKLRIRAFGQFGMKVDDYRIFLTELIGALNPLEVVNHSKMLDYFKGVLVMKSKALIAQAIINQKISALEISASIDDISEFCKEEISEEFARFGLKVMNFYIKSINFPDEDFEGINEILKDKAKFDIIGDQRYATKRSFDTLETAAGNSSGAAGTFIGAGVGLGAGLGAGQAMANVTTSMNTGNPQTIENKCSKCGAALVDGALFCAECGNKSSAATINCYECKKEINASSKFCPFCGTNTKQTRICSGCKTENDMSTKFCKECGTKLEGTV